MDPLSDVFSLLKVKSVLSARFEAADPWGLRFPAYRHVKFAGVIKGTRWVWIEGVTAPVKMQKGDFCLLTDGQPYCFASDPSVELQDGEKRTRSASEDSSNSTVTRAACCSISCLRLFTLPRILRMPGR